MSSWVGIPQRVVEHHGVAIERLGVAGPRHNRVGAEEAAEGGRVEPRAVVIQAAQRILLALARKFVRAEIGVPLTALLAERLVVQLTDLVARPVRGWSRCRLPRTAKCDLCAVSVIYMSAWRDTRKLSYRFGSSR